MPVESPTGSPKCHVCGKLIEICKCKPNLVEPWDEIIPMVWGETERRWKEMTSKPVEEDAGKRIMKKVFVTLEEGFTDIAIKAVNDHVDDLLASWQENLVKVAEREGISLKNLTRDNLYEENIPENALMDAILIYAFMDIIQQSRNSIIGAFNLIKERSE